MPLCVCERERVCVLVCVLVYVCVRDRECVCVLEHCQWGGVEGRRRMCQ